MVVILVLADRVRPLVRDLDAEVEEQALGVLQEHADARVLRLLCHLDVLLYVVRPQGHDTRVGLPDLLLALLGVEGDRLLGSLLPQLPLDLVVGLLVVPVGAEGL